MSARTAMSFAFLALAGVSAPQAAPEGHEVLVIRVSVSGDRYALRDAQVVRSPVPLRAARPRLGDVSYELVDARGEVVAKGEARVTRELRGPLPMPGEPAGGHATVTLPEGELILRLPASAARELRLRSTVGGAAKPQRLPLPAAVAR